MKLFAILRRDGFIDSQDLEASSVRSVETGEEMKTDISWIRSYVLNEERGGLGTICIYAAKDKDTIFRHAKASNLPITEIIPIADTVIVRPDPA